MTILSNVLSNTHKVNMKPWWDNPKYHSSSVDNKIATWADHCQSMEYDIDMLKTANGALSQQILDAINILDGNNDPIDTNDDSQPELLLKLCAHLEYFELLKTNKCDQEPLSERDNHITK